MKLKITVLGGDGIGVEVTREAIKVLKKIARVYDYEFEFSEALIGGAAIRAAGAPLPEETLAVCFDSDAVLLGAVGAPEFDDLLPEHRPEIGLLKLRQNLGGFANLRPAKVYPALANISPLRPEILGATDLLIVRELLGGLYFGEPRGFNGEGTQKSAYNTMRYSVAEIERVAIVAFQAARGRSRKLASVDKANVLETSRLWRETVNRVAQDFSDVAVEHLYVDACAMHLVTNPTRFDVILTENLFGDILSDEAAVLTGSLGMLGSASVGGKIDLYEPVHGSAPDIAGKNTANPLGAIASAAMLLRYTAKAEAAAAAIETAINQVLENGYRTPDIIGRQKIGRLVSTEQMGSLVEQCLTTNSKTNFAYQTV